MATLRRSKGSDGLFIRPTIGGCFDRFSPWRKGEISGGALHIGTPTNCYRPMIDMFDRAVAKYMEGESDEKV
jgi:hypothetical protein